MNIANQTGELDFYRHMDSYDFNHTKRGRAIIISNKHFKLKEDGDRRGATVDTKRMKKLFTRLGFNVKDYRDLTKGEMIEKLKKAASNEQKKHNDTAKKQDADCFVCVISSHGMQKAEVEKRDGVREIHREQLITGVDGKTVTMSKIIGIFDDANCPCLIGKPKLFFIQACRSNSYQSKADWAKGRDTSWDEGVKINEQTPESVQKQGGDTPDAKGSKDTEQQYSTDTNESEYDTSDAEPDSDYEDPDYELQENKSEIYATNKTKDDAVGDSIDAIGKEAPPLQQESQGEQKTTVSNVELAEIEILQEKKVQVHVKDSGDILDARDPNALRTKDAHVIDIVHSPCLNDMLIMYASPQDKFAFSNSEGSWLISALYYTMKDLNFKPKDLDFLSFLLQVSKHMVDTMDFQPGETADKHMRRKRGSKTVPCTTHMLRHDIYFDDTKLRDKKLIPFLL